MWVALLKSGVHATLSGVILAMFIPIRARVADAPSPLKSLESDLHASVAFMVLPVFAFCNAGVALSGVGADQVLHRSEEHTSELQPLMRISSAVFCLKNTKHLL